ncbi:PAS domain-containing protein [Kordiimonas aestuarii]|uniref:PAS domain-containing protein n=1 Tax=Kordiimonas aestuarii TaxID=1005925 RepID=UPI0021D33297|nr:PAS domain-containing protein [Kordiimonas aestuarii]
MFKLSADFDSFLERWHMLPRSAHKLVPCKRDITPMQFGEMLQNIGIAEAVGHQDMRVLFYGSGIERVSGLKVTGKNYYDLLPPEFVKPLSVFHAYVLGTPCGAYVGDVVTTPGGSKYLYETLQYPLADEQGVVKYLMVYGLGRKPFGEEGDRDNANIGRDSIKEMRYLDLGAGAPAARIENFEFHR